jgi:hypothetical protein
MIASNPTQESHRITFTSYGAGADPKILPTQQVVEADWDEVDCCVSGTPSGDHTQSCGSGSLWRVSTNATRSFNMLTSGETARNPYYTSAPSGDKTDCDNYSDGYAFGYANDNYMYLRLDSGNPGTREVGERDYGVYVESRDYVTIDGIHVVGPSGSDTASGAGDLGNIGIKDSEYITVQNCTLEHAKNYGIKFFWAPCDGNTATLNVVDGAFSGITSSGDCDDLTMTWNRVINASTIDGDNNGDRNSISCGASNTASNWLVEYNYVKNQGHSAIPAANRIDHAITSSACQGTIRYNHVETVARGCISIAGGDNVDLSGSKIHYNVCRDWAKYPATAGTYDHNGIRLDARTGTTIYADADDCEIIGNTVSDGAAVGDTGGSHAAYRIGYRTNNMDNLKFHNNIGDNSGTDNGSSGYLELSIGGTAISGETWYNNNFYNPNGSDVILRLGAQKTVAEFNALGAQYADNIGTDCTPNADGTLPAGSDCIDSGKTLAAAYDDGLHPSTTDFTTTPPTVNTLDQDSYGSGWEIGAFVTETLYFASKTATGR